jgi:hypothetical protein
MSGRKSDPDFAAMIKAAHQRKFDNLVFGPADQGLHKGDTELPPAPWVEREIEISSH